VDEYEPDEMADPATIDDIRQEGRYQHERRYLINAVVEINGSDYIALSEVPPFTAPPTTPWSEYTP
jgi:hypothetical protein|tara:strand:+ start:582 stop:779 length:198 start_codon:yes stop_codon:yes gene_type:complete